MKRFVLMCFVLFLLIGFVSAANWCDGYDVNRDGLVNSVDWEMVKADIGLDDCSIENAWCDGKDINNDGKVNADDWREVYLIGELRGCSGISCSEADYDSDGDVDFSDLFNFRKCYNKSVEGDCDFWDYNDDGFVGYGDLSSFRQWYQKQCSNFFDFSELTCLDVDFNLDGVVNAFDLLSVRQCYNKSSSEFSSQNESCLGLDLNGDDFIGDFELEAVRFFYLEECDERVCNDSDGGINYSVKGVVRIEGVEGDFVDFCVEHFKEGNAGVVDYYELEEGYCEDGMVKSEKYICPKFCQDGACVDILNESNENEDINESNLMIKNIKIKGVDYGYKLIGEDEFRLVIKPDIELEGFDDNDFFFFEVNVEDLDGRDIEGCSSKVVYSESALTNVECDVELSSGIYSVGVLVDSEYEINESNEDDNYYRREIKIKNVSEGEDPVTSKSSDKLDSDSSNSSKEEQIDLNGEECSDCLFEGRCFELGYRRAINSSLVFCSESGWEEQSVNGSCNNNFECESNVCVSGECLETSFIQKILNWFRRIFS